MFRFDFQCFKFFRKLKEKRRKIQEQNKRQKESVKQVQKEKSLKGMQKGRSETDISMQKAAREANVDELTPADDDREYFRQEVGEEPENGT